MLQYAEAVLLNNSNTLVEEMSYIWLCNDVLIPCSDLWNITY
jgi:hypothetical protein